MRNPILVLSLFTGVAAAQVPPLPSDADRPKARESGIEGRLGVGVTSQYFFRGIAQATSGLIVQPWIELGYDLLDSDDGVQDLRIVVGQWDSVHRGRTAPGGAVWYESQNYVGLEAKIADRFFLATRYNTYSSPNVFGLLNGLTNIEELAFYGRFDDKGVFFDDLSLNPTATLAFELNNSRDSFLGQGKEGTYLELGVAPQFDAGMIGDSPVTISVPAKFGLSLHNYYERPAGGNDEFFGFFQVGAVASMPLNYLPARLGPWHGDVGLHLLLLGDNNKDRNNGHGAELIFTVGMSTMF